MNAKSANTIYLIAVALTVFLIAAYHLFPQKRFVLIPDPLSWMATGSDGDKGGASSAQFLSQEGKEQDYSRWQCNLREGAASPYCNLTITLNSGNLNWTEGLDFSGFDELHIKMRYNGPAKKMRIHMRNYEPAISSIDNYNSAKFNNIILRTSDFSNDIHIQLSEFDVADWWIDSFNIPRKWSKPNFDRVTNFGIDFATPAPIGDHLLEFETIEFVGSYISAENWYLTILIAWMTAIATFGVVRLHELRIRNRQDARRLREMSQHQNELKRDTKNYLALSKTDALTGTLNRFGLQEIIDVSFEWRQPKDELALLIIDLDLFKRVNDNYGHDVGDKVLIKTGQLLNNITRCVDTVARWGGEEFIVICPHTSMASAVTIAEKIRKEVEATDYPEHDGLHITASLGVTLIKHEDSFDTAFKRADEALYRAKQDGRNMCIVG